MGMLISEWCVAQASELAVEDQAEESRRLEASGLEVRCGFCGKRPGRGCSWSQRLAGRLAAVWPGRSDLRRVPGPVRGNPGRHLILTAPGRVSWRGPHPRVDDAPCRDLQLEPQLFEHFSVLRECSRCRLLLGFSHSAAMECTTPDGGGLPGRLLC
jgi:hypothetical protein